MHAGCARHGVHRARSTREQRRTRSGRTLDEDLTIRTARRDRNSMSGRRGAGGGGGGQGFVAMRDKCCDPFRHSCDLELF